MSSHGYPVESGPRRHRGFSLIELMISLVIGLVILGALVALFTGTSRANREMSTANSVIENGRFAIQLLENDLVHGGFWGTYVPLYDDQTAADAPPDVPEEVPDPCLAYSTTNWDTAYVLGLLAIPVQVYASDDLGDSSCGDVVTDAQVNSDVLVVRHADTCVAGAANCEPDTPDWLYFQSSLCTLECDDDPEAGRFVLDTTRDTPANDAAVFSLRRRDGVTLADKRRFVSNLYYVRDFAVTAGDGIPTLMRSSFALDGTLDHHPGAAVPLVEGVEAIRIELGVDDANTIGTLERDDYLERTAWENPATKEVATNRGDGMPDGLFRLCSEDPCHDNATADDAFTLMNVTAVRIHVLARSRDETQGYTDTKTYRLGNSATVYGPYDDGFKRHVYTTTVRLPNIAGRRLRP